MKVAQERTQRVLATRRQPAARLRDRSRVHRVQRLGPTLGHRYGGIEASATAGQQRQKCGVDEGHVDGDGGQQRVGRGFEAGHQAAERARISNGVNNPKAALHVKVAVAVGEDDRIARGPQSHDRALRQGGGADTHQRLVTSKAAARPAAEEQAGEPIARHDFGGVHVDQD